MADCSVGGVSTNLTRCFGANICRFLLKTKFVNKNIFLCQMAAVYCISFM